LLKDRDSKRILLKDLLKDGLYQLELKAKFREFEVKSNDAMVYFLKSSSVTCNKKLVADKKFTCIKSQPT
jgi:hypothetical protein